MKKDYYYGYGEFKVTVQLPNYLVVANENAVSYYTEMEADKAIATLKQFGIEAKKYIGA